MDSSEMAGPLVIAVWAILLLGGYPLVAIIRSSSLRNAELGRVPAREALPQLAELRPTQLALLVGEAPRAGEVALMDLYLCGHLRPAGGKGLMTMAGSASPRTSDPLSRGVLEAAQNQGATTAGILRYYATQSSSGAMDELRAELAEAGLLLDSKKLRGALTSRAGFGSLLAPFTVLALCAAAVGAVMVANPAWDEVWWIPLLLAGLGTAALTITARKVMTSTGGAYLSTNTPAGEELVAEAAQRYGFAEGQTSTGQQLHREEALLSTAVTGFLRMRLTHAATAGEPAQEEKKKHRPGEVERRDGSAAAVVPAGQPADEGTSSTTEGETFDVDSVRGIAHFFQE